MLRRILNKRLKPTETAIIIVVVAGLSLLAFLGYKAIQAQLFARRIDAALPKILDDIRAQRASLVQAMEAYKAHFGSYPPDHVLSRTPQVVDPVTNTLFYELSGVVLNPTNRMFEVAGAEAAEADYVKKFLHCDTFRNCTNQRNGVKTFLPPDRLPAAQLHDDPDVYALGVAMDFENRDPEVLYFVRPLISSWRYVCSVPTNNPGKFDLWVELKLRGRTTTIGNWKKAE